MSDDRPGSKERGPTSRRRHALRRLRALAGRYRTRFWAAVVVAGGLALALLFVGVRSFGEEEAVTLGTGRASVADSVEAAADSTAVDAEASGGEHVGAGAASYYGKRLAGRPTASGEAFDPAKLTAAHRTLPLGSRVRVTNLRNGKSVVVRINDRGPYHSRRIIDLSRRAARRLGMLGRGKARVRLELLEEE